MDLQLNGKVAVITGGSIGIGKGLAEGLAREGVNVVLCARKEAQLQETVAEIKNKYRVKAIGVPADVTKAEDIARIESAAMDAFGGVDILINNAGTGSNEKIMDAPDDKWQYYWDLHVMAAVRLARAFVPSMKARGGGSIVHIASICAKQPLWYEPIYNTTKAALMMFSKTLANEVIPFNIRVNCVNPGLILTPDWKKTATQLTEGTGRTWEDYLDEIAKDNAPIGRFATTEELSHFIVFLVSPLASYCVGSEYYVDGGWLKTVA